MHEALSSGAQKLLEQLFGKGAFDVEWEKPAGEDHGDATTTIALKLAKELGKPPRAIAEQIAEGLKKLPAIEKVEVAGPGYVNVWYTAETLLQELEKTREA